ncbi:MAG: general secretion pathway protein C [Rhizobacter sp.]|nr:general secretion pathway protein C [Rhizobacter sp.]
MQARLSAFVIWALVAAGVAFWGLRLVVRPAPLPAHVQSLPGGVTPGGDFTRLFGRTTIVETEAPAPVAESSRFKLLGVLAPVPHANQTTASEYGVALIAVDGKTARPYAVGAALDAGLVLQSVGRRSASIGPAGGAASVVLELPPPAAPATGTLPVARSQYEPAPPQAMPAQAPPEVRQYPEGVPAAPLPTRRSDAPNPAVR